MARAADEAALPSAATEVFEKFDRVVEEAREAMLKAIDDQIALATKNGDLAEVKLFQSDREEFEKRGIFPRSPKLKNACTKCRSSLKVNLAKSKQLLEAIVKEKTKASDIATAERVQKELDELVRQWRDIASGDSSSMGPPKSASAAEATPSTEPVASKEKQMFTVVSATWGANEMFNNKLERRDVTKAFSKLLASGEEITINVETLGHFDPPIKSNKALNVEFLAGKQKLVLWMNGATRIRLIKAKPSKEPVWGEGPIQFLSATWGLADGTKETDRLADFKEKLSKRGLTATGYHEFGEIERGKLKVMKMKIQAEDWLLDLVLAEPSRIEIK